MAVLSLALAAFLISFLVTFLTTPFVIRHARKAGHVGRDIHKPGRPEVPELGGVAIAAGIIAAMLFAVAANSFGALRAMFDGGLEVVYLLAALCVVLMVELVGLVDDVLGLRQLYKFLLPFFIALPLMAVRVSELHAFAIPLLGIAVAPLLYELVLIPIGVAAATNLTNTFAGFNGIEAGMGAVIAFFLLVISALSGNAYSLLLSAMLLGALIAFLRYNWYPSKIFPDDVGTLLIGAMIATIAILGGIETAAVILMLPYIVDFIFFKLPNRMPSTGWWGTLKGGKLVHSGKPIHLAQWVMRRTDGIAERDLTLLFIAAEIVLGAVAIIIYIWWT